MSKPIIGISINIRPEEGSHGEFRISKSYVDFVVKAGGVPQLIPIVDQRLVPNFIDLYDGILFSGGGGLLPNIKEMDELPDLETQNPQRYAFEVQLIHQAIDRNIPIMGVCRGHQMINDALGGTVKNLNDESHRQRKPYDVGVHKISIEKNSQLYKVVNRQQIPVNSLHRQVIDQLGDSLVATAYSDDGYIEAIEGRGEQFVMGIQFHPELMPKDEDMLNIYRQLVEAAK